MLFIAVITAVEIGVLAKKCWKENNWIGFKERSGIKIISSVVCMAGGAGGSAIGGLIGGATILGTIITPGVGTVVGLILTMILGGVVCHKTESFLT